MNFDFTPEQEQFRDQIRRFLEKTGGLAVGRRVLEGEEPYSKTMWKGLAELGVQAVTIAEEHGGLGLGLLELCVAAEEVGRFLAPIPFLSSVCVCAEAIRLFGSPDQCATWLPGLADGSIIGTWGTEGSTRWIAGRLSGTKAPVQDGMTAGLMLVVTADAQDVPVMVLCDLTQTGVKRQVVPTIDPTRSAARIEFDAVEATPLPRGKGDAWDNLRNRVAVLLAFEQLGGAEAALAMARTYALERSAFARKIGSFQAVKHKLADMYARIELARGHCYYGAWALSTGAPETALAAAGARCSASEAFEFAAQENVQVHGGIGVTWESDCQLFYRRARLASLVLGSRYEWQDRLVAALEAQHSGMGVGG